MKGKIGSIYLSENEWELLDDLGRNNKIRSRSEMIRLLINWETERGGFSTISLEEVEKDKEKHLAEIKKLELQAERIKATNPLISAREIDLNVEYDETIAILLRNISRGDSLTDIERIAEVRSKVFLKNKWLPKELVSKAYSIIEDRMKKSELI